MSIRSARWLHELGLTRLQPRPYHPRKGSHRPGRIKPVTGRSPPAAVEPVVLSYLWDVKGRQVSGGGNPSKNVAHGLLSTECGVVSALARTEHKAMRGQSGTLPRIPAPVIDEAAQYADAPALLRLRWIAAISMAAISAETSMLRSGGASSRASAS